MERYRVRISKEAEKDLKKLYKSGRTLDIGKVEFFFKEIKEHPKIGLGFPEQLKHHSGEVWSRKINKKDRFVYEIFEQEITITVIQSLGHYEDK